MRYRVSKKESWNGGKWLNVSKYVRSGCTTALNVIPWETDGESVLREAMTNTIVTTPVNVTGAPVTNIVANNAKKPEKFNGQKFKRCFEAFRNLMCHNYALYGLNDIKTEAMRESDLRIYNGIQEVIPFFENIFPCSTTRKLEDHLEKYEVVQDQRQRDDNDLQDER
ncbi:hypothetical protein Tco_1252542 [Tanacetum coccineum]